MYRIKENMYEGNAQTDQPAEAVQPDQRLEVHCPHYESCDLGQKKPRNNRYRCYGRPIEVVTAAVEMAIAYKCPYSGRLLPMVIRGGKIRHLQPDTEEHQRLKKLLKPIRCKICQRRIFDAHVFGGQARIHIKCPGDRLELNLKLGR